MTDYTELIKELRHDGEHIRDKWGRGIVKVRQGEMMIQAAGVIEELTRENESLAKSVNEASDILRRRWISVKERLPKAEYGESDSVLAMDKLGLIRVAYFDGGNWCEQSGEALKTTGKFPITHWMPLPEPPKEES